MPDDGARQPVLVRVEDVHVTYRVYEDARLGLRTRLATRQLRRRYREVPAVRGVTFVLRRGDALGIVGPNGSGKSTLLAALTGLLPVDRGRILVRSRPTLLAVGSALRPQLSGRRNILLGGLAIGMTRDEIEQRMDEIIDFSGLREFIDLPVNAYSSGMKARLLFSIATTRTPEILLIDEALAVGDLEFRRRSSERISELRQASSAIVLVSHNLDEIRTTCTRAIWLDHGLIQLEGTPGEVVEAYQLSRTAS